MNGGESINMEFDYKTILTPAIIFILLGAMVFAGIQHFNLFGFFDVKNTKTQLRWVPIINCCRCNLTEEQANAVSGMVEWDDCYMIQGNMKNLSARIFVNITGPEGFDPTNAEQSFSRLLSNLRINQVNETYRELIIMEGDE